VPKAQVVKPFGLSAEVSSAVGLSRLQRYSVPICELRQTHPTNNFILGYLRKKYEKKESIPATCTT
jgi:hypothetical protein